MKRALRNSVFVGAFLAAGALATPSMAADPTFVDYGAMTFDWTGFYAGVHGGAGSSRIGWNYVPGPATAHHSGSGALGGVQVGYNMQHGPWVFGAEGDLALARISGSTVCPNPAFSCQSRIDWLGSARLRAGYAFDQMLIYGTGGLGMGGVRIQTVNAAGTVFGQRRTQTGWAAGGGAEFAFADGWSVKGEYMYYDLGRATFAVDPPDIVSARTRIHTGKIGVNFRW